MKPALPEPSGRIPGRRLLHSPGPTPVPEEVLWAMSRQPMDLGDRRGDETIAACEAGLRRLLQTDAAEVFLYASNGHGVWEAVVENLLPLGGTALVPGTGHFSESWAEQTEALGRRVLRTPWVAGRPIDLSALAQALRDDALQTIRAVFVVHTDTSSGVSTDLAALRAAMDATGHPALLVVDVVASLGAAPFAMDALRADVVVGASQKGLMCPPGIGLVAVNAAAMARGGAADRSRRAAPRERRRGRRGMGKVGRRSGLRRGCSWCRPPRRKHSASRCRPLALLLLLLLLLLRRRRRRQSRAMRRAQWAEPWARSRSRCAGA